MTPAVTITARNALAATGMSWRRVRELAARHGVPIMQLSRRCLCVSAVAFAAAVDAEAAAVAPRPLSALDRWCAEP